jgi:hypothetical protein
MIRRWLLGAALVMGLASMLLAKQGVVKTQDGRTLEGDVDESAGPDADVAITIHGVTITLPRSDIASIDYPGDVTQEFNDKLAKLDRNDVSGRLDLARWALARQQFALARRAADAAQRLAPNDLDIQTLQDTIEAQQRMAARQGAGATAATPGTPTTAAAPATTAPAPQAKFLSIDDVYTIRRAELRQDEDVRIQFLREVQKRYLIASKANAAAFNAAGPAVQALAIQAYDPQMAQDVRITSDPQAMAEYRTQIEPRILAGCASSGCHNSENVGRAGNFYLYTNVRSSPASYTNFYILQNYSRKVDTTDAFGKGEAERAMIDRLHAQSSLLVQYALPRVMASTPHPDVPNWKPMYWRTDDPACAEILNWIGTTLRPIRPDYEIKFDVPWMPPPTTEPSTATTSPG